MERVRLLALVISLVAVHAAASRTTAGHAACRLRRSRDAIRRLAAGGTLTPRRDGGGVRRGHGRRGDAGPGGRAADGAAREGRDRPTKSPAPRARCARAMIPLPAADPDGLVDTCGTGGGALSTFNICTAAALVAAGAGVRVAKHGNRSFTSRCGSADVLEALGVADRRAGGGGERGAGARRHRLHVRAAHASRHAARGPVRRELAVPTVMNIVGPLANPASARAAGGRRRRRRSRGAARRGAGGARAACTRWWFMVSRGWTRSRRSARRACSKCGRARCANGRSTRSRSACRRRRRGELAGGGPEENARSWMPCSAGRGRAGARTAVVLNAAAALYVSGGETDFAHAVERARQAVGDGAGARALDRMRDAYAARRGTSARLTRPSPRRQAERERPPGTRSAGRPFSRRNGRGRPRAGLSTGAAPRRRFPGW